MGLIATMADANVSLERLSRAVLALEGHVENDDQTWKEYLAIWQALLKLNQDAAEMKTTFGSATPKMWPGEVVRRAADLFERAWAVGQKVAGNNPISFADHAAHEADKKSFLGGNLATAVEGVSGAVKWVAIAAIVGSVIFGAAWAWKAYNA